MKKKLTILQLLCCFGCSGASTRMAEELSLNYVEHDHVHNKNKREENNDLATKPNKILDTAQEKIIETVSSVNIIIDNELKHLKNIASKNSELKTGKWFKKHNSDVLKFMQIYPLLEGIKVDFWRAPALEFGLILTKIEQYEGKLKANDISSIEIYKYELCLRLVLNVLNCKSFSGTKEYVGNDPEYQVREDYASAIELGVRNKLEAIEEVQNVGNVVDFEEPLFSSFYNILKVRNELKDYFFMDSFEYNDESVAVMVQKANPESLLAYWATSKALVDGSWDSCLGFSKSESSIIVILKDISFGFTQMHSFLNNVYKSISNIEFASEKNKKIDEAINLFKTPEIESCLEKSLLRIKQLKSIINEKSLEYDKDGVDRLGLRWVGEWRSDSQKQIPVQLFKKLLKYLDWFICCSGTVLYGENLILPLNYTSFLLKGKNPWIVENNEQRNSRLIADRQDSIDSDALFLGAMII